MKHRYIFLSSRLRSTDLPSAGLSHPEQDTGLACKEEKRDSIYPSPLALAAGTAENLCSKKERRKRWGKKPQRMTQSWARGDLHTSSLGTALQGLCPGGEVNSQ